MHTYIKAMKIDYIMIINANIKRMIYKKPPISFVPA